MHFFRLFVLAGALCATMPAEAAPKCKPLAPARIAQMWDHYRAQPGASAPSIEGELQCVSIDPTYQLVCRTRSRHYAHPSIVIRTVVQTGKAIEIRTEADTAANCDAFRRLIDEYNQLTKDTVGKL